MGNMSVSNLFFKVEVEHDAGEGPERIAAEIRRQIRRAYGVREVEFTNFTTMDGDTSGDREES